MQNQKSRFKRHREASVFMIIKAIYIRSSIWIFKFCILFYLLILIFCMRFQNAFGEITEKKESGFIPLKKTAAHVE